MTVLVEFSAHPWTVDGNIRERTIAGVFGTFGHGNAAGVGQALAQLHEREPGAVPYYQARNEQAMVHQSVGSSRMHRRRVTLASAASVGPGATNVLTGAALATTNRLPALLLPSDTYATRVADPVLQQLEQPWDPGLSVKGDERLPVDLAMNARSYGIDVVAITPGPDAVGCFHAAVVPAKAADTSTVIHVETDPLVYGPDGEASWDVPVPEVSDLESTRAARVVYEQKRVAQRPLLGEQGTS